MIFHFAKRKKAKKSQQESFRISCQGGEICLIFGHKSSISSRNFFFFSFFLFFLLFFCVFPSKVSRSVEPTSCCRANDVDVRGKISSSLKREFRLCVEEKMKKKGEKRCFVRETPSNPVGFIVLRHLLNIFHQRFSTFDSLGHRRQRKTWLWKILLSF